MEKHLTDELRRWAAAVQVEIGEAQAERLGRFADLLLAWNRKINLTAITNPSEVVEKHLFDSLAAAPLVVGAGTVIDLGAGGGMPGVPLAVATGEQFVLVDTVGKKVGFLKAAIAQLGLANARAIHARAEGQPEAEGLPICGAAICRAFLEPKAWLGLAPAYVRPGGLILAMLGAETPLPEQLPAGVTAVECRSYRLPVSGAERRIAVYRRE